jgi:hypothetical protein
VALVLEEDGFVAGGGVAVGGVEFALFGGGTRVWRSVRAARESAGLLGA